MAELLRMPEIAAGMESALLSTWTIGVNTPYSAGDVIAVIETDKAVVDVEAETDGVILRTLVADGDEVPVGAPIALIAGADEIVTDIDATLRDLGVSADPEAIALEVPEAESPSEHTTIESATHTAETPAPTTRLFASPIARRMAKDAGVDIAQIIGTGPGGRIVRRDVVAATRKEPVQAPSATSTPSRHSAPESPATAYIDTPHSRLRRAIATRLTESKQTAPHFYLRGKANVDRLLAMREELNAGEATRITVNDLVIKAVAKAHMLVPALNVTWTPDAVRSYSNVDIAVAIATDNGLVTPVLRSVENMPISVVTSTVMDFAERSRAGRLQQHELEGGSISVTNLGMFGTEEFAAIINPPQSAILAVGAAHQEPVAVDGALAVATVMRVTLSIDHRPVDGVNGAQWMKMFLDLLEHPSKILV
jgi:pyruvate dehydrogenase E2 component (dihydrolipoamide acetyltransferase)